MSDVLPTNARALAPPGAGLPAVELLFARLLFSVRRLTGSREAFTARFKEERERISALYSAHKESMLHRPVLITRLKGMEDSSRNWSVYMTLEHLRIVNESIAMVIGQLVQNRIPPGKASTANVKPAADCVADVVAPYEASCDTLLSTIAANTQLKTAVRFAHPWFGPFDASGWHAMAGMHMAIHRLQIERILR